MKEQFKNQPKAEDIPLGINEKLTSEGKIQIEILKNLNSISIENLKVFESRLKQEGASVKLKRIFCEKILGIKTNGKTDEQVDQYLDDAEKALRLNKYLSNPEAKIAFWQRFIGKNKSINIRAAATFTVESDKSSLFGTLIKGLRRSGTLDKVKEKLKKRSK